MRLVATFKSEKNANKLFVLLISKNIECNIDRSNSSYDVWVKNEDQAAIAKEYYKSIAEMIDKTTVELEIIPPPLKENFENAKFNDDATPIRSISNNRVTRLFITACVFIFIIISYQYYDFVKNEKINAAMFPIYTSLQKKMLYDFPPTLELMEKFNKNYKISTEEEVANLPQGGKELLNEINNSMMWLGLYDLIVNYDNKTIKDVSLFSDIKKGEIWRSVTPIFLHANFLHIAFNMLWLWMLGKAMENNIGALRYIIFVILTAVVTNTLQYLMTGPLFMGFSGVIAAMGGYIWVRKKRAPWEIYLINQSTLKFLGIFIFGMLSLTTVVFILQIFHIVSFQIPIANSAHVSGIFLGGALGYVKWFNSRI